MYKKILVFMLLVKSFIIFSQDNSIHNPIANFDYLWETFNRRYANFELKNINWDYTYTKYRLQINDSTTNEKLFDVCNKMILCLKDGHSTILQNDQNGNFIRESEDGSFPAFLKKFPIDKNQHNSFLKLIDLTTTTLIKKSFQNFQTSKENVLTYATNENTAYLRIRYMSKLKKREYNKALEKALISFENKKNLILDLRFNPGGHNHISHMIANHFTDTKRVAHYYKERIPSTNSFTKLKTCYLKPNKNITFTKPIIILTSDFTASSAETFTLGMKQLPYVTILGDHTNGIFSEIYSFKLPNKWDVSLSNQQYLSADKKNYEGIGIPPDISMQNTFNDFENQEDSVLIKAIDILNKK